MKYLHKELGRDQKETSQVSWLLLPNASESFTSEPELAGR